MSRKMNKMLRDAGCLDFRWHKILCFAPFLSFCKMHRQSSVLRSAAGVVLFVQIIPHRALIILLFDFQNNGTVRLLLLRKNPVLNTADIQPLPVTRHLILYQAPSQLRIGVLF